MPGLRAMLLSSTRGVLPIRSSKEATWKRYGSRFLLIYQIYRKLNSRSRVVSRRGVGQERKGRRVGRRVINPSAGAVPSRSLFPFEVKPRLPVGAGAIHF